MGTYRPLRAPLLAAGGAFAEHPGVLARAAALHRHHLGIGLGSHAGQTAGQYPVTVGAGHGVDAHADGAVLQVVFDGVPHRRLGQLRQLLGDIRVRPRAHALGQGLALCVVQVTAEDRVEAL